MVEGKAGRMPAVPGRNSFQRVSRRPLAQHQNQRANKKPGGSSERRAQESVVTKIVCHLIKRRHEKRRVYTNVSHFRLVSHWRIWNPHSTFLSLFWASKRAFA